MNSAQRFMDALFHPLGQLLFTLLALGVVLAWARRPRARPLVLAVTALLYTRYMMWRGWYTLNLTDVLSAAISVSVFLAEVYGFFQFLFFLFQTARPTKRTIPPLTHTPTVDIFVTIVDEPLAILHRTLVGCVAQEYPRERVTVFVLDDGRRDDVQRLATQLGCQYVRRPDRGHAKAGNLNFALERSSGDLVAVFDVDHVPSRSFLRKTVGFFDDPSMAFVQARHHFDNPDVFQRNLKLSSHVRGEQELFFRLIEPGRDRYNAAFFAGSTGIFRRRTLMEVGGFRTETLTEDVHTSLLLHARGYRSCYVNEPLSSGLMPDTFAGYLKQRTRWAIGATQIWLRENPVLNWGLHWSQRVCYAGSIFYFFLGLPRIVYLLAPLAWLLMGVPVLIGETATLVHFFFSHYLGSAIAARVVTRGTRNPFWSDVYEVAMCFSLTGAVLKTVAAPTSQHRFEVTPKGQQVYRRHLCQLHYLWPHCVTLVLLIMGVVMGVHQVVDGVGPPGLWMGLLWGVVNLILIVAAISAAYEQPQVRRAYRVPREYLIEFRTEHECVAASTVDFHEGGLSAVVPTPLFEHRPIQLLLTDHEGRLLSVMGKVARQEAKADGQVLIGMEFVDVDQGRRSALIRRTFSSLGRWQNTDARAGGLWISLGVLLLAPFRAHRRVVTRRRRIPRYTAPTPCRLRIGEDSWKGTIHDYSYTGVSAWLRGWPLVAARQRAVLEVGEVVLNVAVRRLTHRLGRTLIGFKVRSVQTGGQQWRAVHQASWPPGGAS